MDILMPQLGETVAEGTISVWAKAVGDSVQPGDVLFEIETDKSSMEITATVAGKLAAINVEKGKTVPVGTVVAVIAEAGGATTSSTSPAPAAPAPAASAPAPSGL